MSVGDPNWGLIWVGIGLLAVGGIIAYLRSIRKKAKARGDDVGWPEVIKMILDLLQKGRFDVVIGGLGAALILAGVFGVGSDGDDDDDDGDPDSPSPAAFVVDAG